MNNLYATPEEIKAAMPDAIRASTVKYDAQLLRLSGTISRFIDGRIGRVCYPSYGTKYAHGDGSELLVIPDALEITSVAVSYDGVNFQSMTSDDWYGSRWDDENHPGSYRTLIATRWGSIGAWPNARRSVRISGWWAYADDREGAWEDTGVGLAAAYAMGATSLAVADKATLDGYGMIAFHAGRILRVDDEIFEVKAAMDGVPNDLLTVARARNGSINANHAEGATIKIWRVMADIQQACIIQAVRQLQRGQQGFGDARANPEMGNTVYFKKLDPEADLLLQGHMTL